MIVVLIAVALLGLPVVFRRGRGTGRGAPAGPPSGYPESLTAVLAPEAEEYLAWLADHHWPDDEYLDLVPDWGGEPRPIGPPCPDCRTPGEDVWPCRICGQLLHSACGRGIRRRKVAKPYRTHERNPETVIAELICTACASIVGLDVDHGDDGAHRS